MPTRPQGIMLQILLIMLFRISITNHSYAHYYSFYARHSYYSIVPIANIIQCTSAIMLKYKLCMIILHMLL